MENELNDQTETEPGVTHCLTCDRPPLRRGLCHRCYQACAAQVRREIITWEDAENLGLARSPRQHGPWMIAYREVAETDEARSGQDGPAAGGTGSGPPL